jgi:hypothetical protein
MFSRHIGTESIEESNRFLRKLWSELDLVRKNGWNYQPHRKGRRITIGWNNFGLVEFDYIQKGTINNIYFESDENREIIENAIDSALEGYRNHTNHTVGISLSNKDGVLLSHCSYDGIEIIPSNNLTEIVFEIDAFSHLDREHFLLQKMYPILFIIYAYTNLEFMCSHAYMKREHKVDGDGSIKDECLKYNYDWIDTDECPEDKNGYLMIPKECMKLIKAIISAEQYEQNLQLLINAGQLLYHSNRMYIDIRSSGKYNQTGYVDAFNTVLVSALEPLSNIGAALPKHCKECGNLVYSINKKIRDFISKYLPPHLVDDICNRSYKNRSKFLHEGYAMTSEYYTGSCFPLINARTGNSMLAAGSNLEFNLREYITYVFRNFERDLLKDEMV